ncbi:MAG: ABC transporter permease, partial [Flammeovirgaceae bacterium]
MLKNFLVISLRNFVRNWSYSLINVMGLSVGMTACIIIYLIINFEKSFDEFHKKRDALYRVVMDSKSASGVEHSATLPYPFIRAFQSDFANIPATQIHHQQTMQSSYGAEKIRVSDVVFADSLFTQLFTYPVLSGNPKTELGQPGKVFLTQSLNDKINSSGNLRTIKLDNKLELDI